MDKPDDFALVDLLCSRYSICILRISFCSLQGVLCCARIAEYLTSKGKSIATENGKAYKQKAFIDS